MAIMGRYLDGLVAQFFKTDEKGRQYYFPLGIWSKGRQLPDGNTAAELRLKVRKVYGATIIAMFALISFAQSSLAATLGVIGIGALATVALTVYLLKLAKPFPKTEVRLTIGEAHRQQVIFFGPGSYYIFAAFFAMLAAACIFILFTDTRETYLWSAPSAIGFGLGALFLAHLARSAKT